MNRTQALTAVLASIAVGLGIAVYRLTQRSFVLRFTRDPKAMPTNEIEDQLYKLDQYQSAFSDTFVSARSTRLQNELAMRYGETDTNNSDGSVGEKKSNT